MCFDYICWECKVYLVCFRLLDWNGDGMECNGFYLKFKETGTLLHLSKSFVKVIELPATILCLHLDKNKT